MRRARHLMGALGVVASTVVLPFALASPAGAIGGSCSSAMEKQVVSGPDMYRVRASCSSIDSDTKVRGVLVINGGLDAPTAWFTTPNKTYYGPWRRLYSWEVGGTKIELARR